MADAIRDPANRAVMRAARAHVETLRSLELEELAERQASATAQAKWTYGMAIGIVVLAFLLGSAGIAFVLAGGRMWQRPS